jgi:hypothetical protein
MMLTENPLKFRVFLPATCFMLGLAWLPFNAFNHEDEGDMVPEMSVDFERIIQRYDPEDKILLCLFSSILVILSFHLSIVNEFQLSLSYGFTVT